MLEIYHGTGKGKTTAAAGLALRAAGNHIPVLFVQFMKNGTSGEIQLLKELPDIQVMIPETFYGFTKNMTEKQKEETKNCYQEILEKIEQKTRKICCENNSTETIHMVVILDEALHACSHQLLSETALCSYIDSYHEKAEIILTGQHPSEQLCQRADYISEIKKIKHPYDKGITARIGIEQ